MTPSRSLARVTAVVSTALIAGLALASLCFNPERLDAIPRRVEKRDLNYPQFLSVVEHDRWGLDGSTNISYRYTYTSENHDQFIKATLPELSYQLALILFDAEDRGHPIGEDKDDVFPDRSTPSPPSWWDVESLDPSEKRTSRFARSVPTSQGTVGSGSLWVYHRPSETLYIWDWVRSEP